MKFQGNPLEIIRISIFLIFYPICTNNTNNILTLQRGLSSPTLSWFLIERPSMKMKRKTVEKKYADALDGLYGGALEEV